ncbi:hypothetical protein V6N13_002954 [Hibiscus sabdariffa]|uniref:Uncharacterized protein n=2 Tax=Hibiscus sabdariffa TaxID=183260 RepID=A0ABR2NYB1_9ROSI
MLRPCQRAKRGNKGRREQTKDDKEYFRDHKTSPLSEIEVADTRKPIMRATDGTATEAKQNSGDVIGWKPEQLLTAEETGDLLWRFGRELLITSESEPEERKELCVHKAK